jgi:hypothetical protein
MDAEQAAQLDDEHYRELVMENAHPPARDPEVWAALISPTNIERTHEAIDNAFQRVTATLRKRRGERQAFQNSCYKRGPEGKQEWFASKSEYDDWRRRAVNYLRTMQNCLSEISKARKGINRASNHNLAGQHRESLRQLAVAVQKHQALHARAGGIAEQCDYELWRLLDQLTVPCGAGQEPTTLRTMLDFYWVDVEQTTAAGEASAAAERAMRSAPAGRSAQFSGAPKARHVGNEKRLA